MCETVFRIVYGKPTHFGMKEATKIAKKDKAYKFIKKCRKHNYQIITIEYV